MTNEALYELQVIDIENFVDNDGLSIPGYMIDGIARYLVYGRIPGDFLTAILNNDLMNAFSHADSANKKRVNTYVEYLYNHMPVGSYGSPERVTSWAESRRAVA